MLWRDVTLNNISRTKLGSLKECYSVLANVSRKSRIFLWQRICPTTMAEDHAENCYCAQQIRSRSIKEVNLNFTSVAFPVPFCATVMEENIRCHFHRRNIKRAHMLCVLKPAVVGGSREKCCLLNPRGCMLPLCDHRK